eukprot:11019194-Alexandrium_andersonii.AAC.1
MSLRPPVSAPSHGGSARHLRPGAFRAAVRLRLRLPARRACLHADMTARLHCGGEDKKALGHERKV